MHLQVTSVRAKQRSYRYARIVQSRRTKGGKQPTKEVIANLGPLTDDEIALWRTALKALREGKPLVVPDGTGSDAWRPMAPAANLEYLHLATLLALWDRWQLSPLLDELCPSEPLAVPISRIVAALAIQRCVQPTPKCDSPAWLATTALPELMDLPLVHFNNTRLHRALDALDDVSATLMDRLAQRYTERDGAFIALFLDVTDAWFVGSGPAGAEVAKTKEGRFERKINIALLCNERGYPLRWMVVAGRQHDSVTMKAMFDALKEAPWAKSAPIVCDRAMGHTAHVEHMVQSGLHFVTSLSRSEFASYAPGLPYQELLHLSLSEQPTVQPNDVQRAAQLAVAAGMSQLDDKTFVLPLGLVTLGGQVGDAARPSCARAPRPLEGPDKTVEAMRLGLQLKHDIDKGRVSGYRVAAKRHGLSRSQGRRLLQLTALPDDVQQAILSGQARALSLNDLRRVLGHAQPGRQRAAFEQMLAKAARHSDPRKARPGGPMTPQNTAAIEKGPPVVRAVAYFNPEMFVQMRIDARAARAAFETAIDALNRTLARPQSTRNADSIRALVTQRLQSAQLTEAYDVELCTRQLDGRPRYQVVLHFNERKWHLRRRFDGFNILLVHPHLTHTDAQLCQLYRDKDTIEKDFQIIKSVIRLRPFHHRLNAKIRAHVTICMLALLLERSLRRKLAASRSSLTAQSALQNLAQCHLNRYDSPTGLVVYRLTQTTEQQRYILRVLRLQHLAEEEPPSHFSNVR